MLLTGEIVRRLYLVLIGILLVLALGLGFEKLGESPETRQLVAVHPNPVTKPAQGVFLVATREMPDPRFQHSVILLLAHSEEGTLGIIVNRPTQIRLSDAVPDLEPGGKEKHWLFFGGPVAVDTLLFLVRGTNPPGQASRVLADIYMSADRPTLEQLLANGQPTDTLRIYFGHAGWAPGQLDAELVTGSWELFQADPEAVFSSDPNGVWEKFMGQSRRLMVRGPPFEERSGTATPGWLGLSI